MAAGLPAGPGSVMFLLALPLITALAVPAAAQTPDAFQISVDVNLVVVPATVRDRKGAIAPELRQQDFRVYEDGVQQPIHLFRHEDEPVTVGLVIDHSGSMRPKMSHVIEAARTFAHSSNPEDQMFVINFNDRVRHGLPAARPFTNRAEELDAAISRMNAGGETALYDAVAHGLDALASGIPRKKVLIIVSDGGDNASVLRMPAVLKKAEESGALIYTIGIFDNDDPDKNPAVLRQFARVTGGDAFFPADISEVVAICRDIARDIRHQYTLGYVSSNPSKPGAFHKIRVTAEADGHRDLQVRTRSGYVK